MLFCALVPVHDAFAFVFVSLLALFLLFASFRYCAAGAHARVHLCAARCM